MVPSEGTREVDGAASAGMAAAATNADTASAVRVKALPSPARINSTSPKSAALIETTTSILHQNATARRRRRPTSWRNMMRSRPY